MIAWQLSANGETPETAQIKGDHFVGSYYVQCENIIREEMALLKAKTEENDYSDFSEMSKAKLAALQEMMAAIITDSEKAKEDLKKMKEDYNEILRAHTPVMKKT